MKIEAQGNEHISVLRRDSVVPTELYLNTSERWIFLTPTQALDLAQALMSLAHEIIREQTGG
jgi:hypothetical protein